MVKTITNTYQLTKNLSLGLDRTGLLVVPHEPKHLHEIGSRKRNVLLLMQASLNLNATPCEQFNKTIQLHKDPIESEIQGQVSKFHFKKSSGKEAQ